MTVPDIEVEQIITLLFAPYEGPIFIDGTPPILEIVHEPASFIENASKFFGMALGSDILDMTIHELAARVRTERTNTT